MFASFGLMALAAAARGQVVAPSVYTTAIQVQGEPLGTEFDDWAGSGIPVVDMDPADNPGGSFIDLANLQIANDSSYIYLHMTMHNPPISLGNLYVAFDTDQNLATGFDWFGIGLIGSEFAYQTDFPFQQATGVFNTGATILGEIALIFPFWTEAGPPFGNEIEWRIPLSAMIGPEPGTPAFPNDSFDLLVATTDGLGDVSQPIRYTLAEPPAGPSGDYNDDGKVDAADYVVWRKNENTSNPLPNDPHGGMIGINQYNTWRENFGAMGGGSGLSNAAVPEPATVALLAAAAFAFAVFRRRR
jgi:hypothetical protein